MHSTADGMQKHRNGFWTLLPLLLLFVDSVTAARHTRFIIHIPLKIHTHHHTTTVYSHKHTEGGPGGGVRNFGSGKHGTKHMIYKLLGFLTPYDDASAAANGRANTRFTGGVSSSNWDKCTCGRRQFYFKDVCDGYICDGSIGIGVSGRAHIGDMIVNNFSREDELYQAPYKDDIDGLSDEWVLS